MIGRFLLVIHEAFAHSVPVLFGRGSDGKSILPFLRRGNLTLKIATVAPQHIPVSPPRVGRLSSDSIPVGGFTPGSILADRYRIIGLLGRGGMGEVYRADDLKLGQPVALKFLPRALASDPVRRERFFAEVRITRQLAHPNICRVYDIEDFEDQPFLSMEYIDGEDLASLIKRIGYLTNQKALEITRQLVAGLAAAHDRGVLHRDLKPANIMIDGHGRVRITDFGLAIAAEDESQALEMFGTPAYMAPEQFAGKGASVRSDIYALGLILYEIYCGKKVFAAPTIPESARAKGRVDANGAVGNSRRYRSNRGAAYHAQPGARSTQSACVRSAARRCTARWRSACCRPRGG